MVRYIKQRDMFSCAPVAIANASRWFASLVGGPHLKDRTSRELKRICDYTSGVYLHAFKTAVRASLADPRLSIEFIARPNLSVLEKHMADDDSSIILVYTQFRKQSHAIFIPKRDRWGFVTINDLTARVSRKTMEKRLKRCRRCRDGYPYAILLRTIQG